MEKVINLEEEQQNEETVDPKDTEESKLIDEEYRVWKKNCPFLYDCVLTHALEWPSLTVQWLPESRSVADKKLTEHKLLLGTQSDGTDPNYLLIAEALLPAEDAEIDAKKFDQERNEIGGYGGTLSKVSVKVKINHDGEVHRARYMPQNPFIIATKSPRKTVLVFDYSKHPSLPTDNVCHPQHRCHGHEEDGYGISWNTNITGQLLSASSDTKLCLWDIKEAGIDVNALQTFSGHDSAVEDVEWHKFHGTVFGSVGGDRQLLVWDVRENKIVNRVAQAHADDINCLSFSPFQEFHVATGGSDSVVKLWDLRKLDSPMHTLEGHRQGVYQLSWSPFNESVLASSSEDRRLVVWDISRIGQEQSAEDAQDGPPELLFIHGGHTAKVFDFSWNQNEHWFISSVAEDNVLQIWQMASNIYDDEDDESQNDINDDDLEGPVTKKPKL